MPLLQQYDSDGSGDIDYKEFSIILFGDEIVRAAQMKADPEQEAKK